MDVALTIRAPVSAMLVEAAPPTPPPMPPPPPVPPLALLVPIRLFDLESLTVRLELPLPAVPALAP